MEKESNLGPQMIRCWIILWLKRSNTMHDTWRINKGDTVKLKDFDPNYTGEHSHKESAQDALKALIKELYAQQEMLWAAHNQRVLMILQGTDTSGKEGTIRHVLAHLNPQGCQVSSF